jgi:hypothetical protein
MRLPGICPLWCTAGDKPEGTNQRGQTRGDKPEGTNQRGTEWGHRDSLRHPSSFTYLPKPDAMRLPGICPLWCTAGDKPEGTNQRGQTRGDKPEGTNQRGTEWGHRDSLRHPSSFPYSLKPDAVWLPGICPLSCKAGDKNQRTGSTAFLYIYAICPVFHWTCCTFPHFLLSYPYGLRAGTYAEQKEDSI